MGDCNQKGDFLFLGRPFLICKTEVRKTNQETVQVTQGMGDSPQHTSGPRAGRQWQQVMPTQGGTTSSNPHSFRAG